ncbi:MAG: ABC transporter substrate-binding protein [Eubacteriales bacterium]|nr:ABC transporter substrate-binding protein [Eubacteriales bacterium]
MKRKVLSACLAATMVFACAATTVAADTVKIGVYEPASGDNGAGGKQETLGIQYANYVQPTVEIDGTEYDVELVIVDNQSSTDKAVSAASELVSNGVSVVLGSYGSGVSIAAADTFKAANTPAIGVTCTNPQVTDGNDYYFRICFLDPFQGSVMANYAKDNYDAKKAYVLTKLGDDYSTGLGFYFSKAFKDLGGEVIEENYPDGTSDFNAYVSKAISENVDVIFAPISIEAAQLVIDQAAAQGITCPLLAGDTWDSNVVLAAAEGTNIDLNVSTFYQSGVNEEFDKGIVEWMESDSTALANNGGDTKVAAVSAMGYDAYFVALEALKNAGSTDPQAVYEALPTTTYTGITGEIAFNEIGDAARDSAIVKKANTETAEWEFVAEQKVK